MAIEANRADNAAVLLEAGADIHVRFPVDANGKIAAKTPLDFAKEKKAKKILALIEASQQPSAKNSGAEPGTLADVWKHLEKSVKSQKGKRKTVLSGAAQAGHLALLEATVGKALPGDFKQAYELHDGQKSGADLIPPSLKDEGYALMPIASIIEEWTARKEMFISREFADKESSPDVGVRDSWWDPGWIPFASSGAGDSICLDLAPASGGRTGQIITINHETSRRELLAPSFAAWLTELAEILEQAR